jgi:hypothetical protein
MATDDVDVIRHEPRLDPEGASGPTLAGKAVAHGDPDRIALRRQMQLPAATGGLAGSHRDILPICAGTKRRWSRSALVFLGEPAAT